MVPDGGGQVGIPREPEGGGKLGGFLRVFEDEDAQGEDEMQVVLAEGFGERMTELFELIHLLAGLAFASGAEDFKGAGVDFGPALVRAEQEREAEQDKPAEHCKYRTVDGGVKRRLASETALHPGGVTVRPRREMVLDGNFNGIYA